tara:strand:+ start:705 stop:1163 length:459 start_codon:yes stop_codon:yes gene_type:complete
MANIREYIRVNPIDRELDRAIGVRFPFNAEGVFHSTYTTKDQVKSNLLSVLLTEPGERVFNPNFGVGLRHQLFENEINKDELLFKIDQQIKIHIPEIELVDTIVNKANDSHELFIGIYYRIIANRERDAIQINFNMDNTTNDSSINSPAVGY